MVLITSIHPILQLLDNDVLFWGLTACGLAQISKLFFEWFAYRRFRLSVLIETGGMPSSHSALVMGTASGLGLKLGFDHPAFALAATIAFVVMYDASGVRMSAGLTAERVNKLLEQKGSEDFEKPLKESLGHTRLEVLIGSLLGPAIALPGIVFIGSPLHLIQLFGLFQM